MITDKAADAVSLEKKTNKLSEQGKPQQSVSCTSHQTERLYYYLCRLSVTTEAIRTDGPLYSSSIRPSQQDSFLYTQFSRTHPSSISSFIHCGTHLSLYLNISMCDLVLKDLLRRI
jgi:hypothetical protein